MAGAVLIPSGVGWNPEMRALTLLAAQRLAVEAGRSDPIGADEASYIRARPADAMLQMAAVQRVTPMLGSVGEPFDEADWFEPARYEYTELRLDCMSHAAVAHRVMQAADAVGARPLLVKGMALAAFTTGDYSLRAGGDIDVVVAPERSEPAVDSIKAMGGRVIAGGPVRDWTQSRNRGIHSTTFSLEGIHIDLHHRLVGNPRLMDMGHDDLFDQRVAVEVGGAGIDTLGLLDSTLLVACHSGNDAWSDLRSVMDTIRLLRLVDSRGDWAGLRDRARAQHVDGRLELAEEVCRPLADFGDSGESGAETRPVSRALAREAWRRLARGEYVRSSRKLRDRIYRRLSAIVSAGRGDALVWDLRTLVVGGSEEETIPSDTDSL